VFGTTRRFSSPMSFEKCLAFQAERTSIERSVRVLLSKWRNLISWWCEEKLTGCQGIAECAGWRSTAYGALARYPLHGYTVLKTDVDGRKQKLVATGCKVGCISHLPHSVRPAISTSICWALPGMLIFHLVLSRSVDTFVLDLISKHSAFNKTI